MRPSRIVYEKRQQIRDIVGRYPVANPRLFGSVLHGTNTDKSDVDMLVDALDRTTLFDLGGLQNELEHLLGTRVDVLTPGELPAKFRDKVLKQAQPL